MNQIKMACKTVKESKESNKGFKERKSTIFKKSKELSTLCEVDLLVIFYEAGAAVPQIWCSKPDGANELISRYYGEKGSKKTEFKELIKRGDNSESIKNMGLEELKKLSGSLEAKIESVGKRIDLMREEKKLLSTTSYPPIQDDQRFHLNDVVFDGYNHHHAANHQVINSVNVDGMNWGEYNEAFNFGNLQDDDGMNDRMIWDTGLYDLGDLDDLEF